MSSSLMIETTIHLSSYDIFAPIAERFTKKLLKAGFYVRVTHEYWGTEKTSRVTYNHIIGEKDKVFNFLKNEIFGYDTDISKAIDWKYITLS